MKPDLSTRWAVLSPNGIIPNDCIHWTKREVIEQITLDLDKPWTKLRKEGWQPVKIKFVVVP